MTEEDVEIFPPDAEGKTRDKIGAVIGMSGRNYSKGKKVYKAAYNAGNEVAMEQVELLERGETSIHSAREAVREELSEENEGPTDGDGTEKTGEGEDGKPEPEPEPGTESTEHSEDGEPEEVDTTRNRKKPLRATVRALQRKLLVRTKLILTDHQTGVTHLSIRSR